MWPTSHFLALAELCASASFNLSFSYFSCISLDWPLWEEQCWDFPWCWGLSVLCWEILCDLEWIAFFNSSLLIWQMPPGSGLLLMEDTLFCPEIMLAFEFWLFEADMLEFIIEEFGGSIKSWSAEVIPDRDVIGLTLALVAGVTDELFDWSLLPASFVASLTSWNFSINWNSML